MGRRKIEIKAIKDDRNRSVTFLKRKGGLFKKAHELSVLCQVDVAVIIFGHNKKLYEFSSGDINETLGRYNYYGAPHEHKGPEDFMGKKDGGSDDDDEDMDDVRPDSRSPPMGPTMAQHLHAQQQFNHMGSASPPMPNGTFHRGPSPQPPNNISRPGSRAHTRQPSQHLMPPQHPQHPQHMQVSQPPQPQQPSYAYMPNPPIYNPQAAAQTAIGMQPRPPPPPPPGQPLPPQFQQYRQPGQPHPQSHQQPHPQAHQQPHPSQYPAQHQQVQQIHAQEQQRRQSNSLPPQYTPQQSPPQPQEQRHPPQPQASPQPPSAQHFSSPPLPQPKPLPAAARTHSIFTPIDDSRSLLAQHWGSSREEIPKSEPAVKTEAEGRSQSIDVASINRRAPNGITHPPPPPPPHINTSQPLPPIPQPQRTASTPIIPSIHAHPPSRTNSLQIAKSRGPKLKVQIPNEDSDDENQPENVSPFASAAATRTPIRDHPGVVLPPPSPSASALLSAGASGPPNPFARPPPPGGVNSFSTNRDSRSDLETPISALPSRFVSDQLLPSPSSFYADWFTNGSARDSNMLPSPLAFPTPVVSKGPSFGEEDERKRRLEDSAGGGTPEKRIKT